MKRFALILLVIFIVCLVYFVSTKILPHATSAQTTFQKTFGGMDRDRGIYVQQTDNGRYIVLGNTKSFGAGEEDVYLIQTDTAGDTIWTKTIGGTGSDNGWAVQQLGDGGYIITGFTNSFGAGGMDVYLIRTNITGDTLWTKTFGGTGDEYGWSIQHTTDGGYIIVAQTSSFGAGEIDAYLIKIDASGQMQWSNTYGGSQVDRIFSGQQTSDGGYIAAGITYSFGAGDRDAYLIKKDADGKLLWSKTFGGERYDVGHSVQQTSDKGYIVTGYGQSFSEGSNDVYFIKTDSAGETQWLKTFGGRDDDRMLTGVQTTDGGYIFTGYTKSFGVGDWDVYLIKTDANGDTLWTKTFGEDAIDTGYTVQQTRDGGYILTGETLSFDVRGSDLYLLKTDSNGNIELE